MVRATANRSIRAGSLIDARERSDEDLLEEYLTAPPPAAEEAFRVLVDRHGPMVLGTCRQVLRHEEDAEDAFQATFLKLARKGATIRDRRVLAGWLHEVAFRTANRLRNGEARRRAVEERGVALTGSDSRADDASGRMAREELRPVLHEEVSRLPEKYRVPVVLSYLEGMTNEEAAALLSCPVGTLKVRLMRARDLLRSRLDRRGVGLSGMMMLTTLRIGSAATDPVPSGLVMGVVGRALGWRFAGIAAGPVEPSAPGDAAGAVSADAVEPARPAVRRPVRRLRLARVALMLLVIFLAVVIGESVAMIAGRQGLGALVSLGRLLESRPPATVCHCR